MKNLFLSPIRNPQSAFRNPLQWWKQSPFGLRAQVIGLLLLFTVLLAVCCAAGCATTSEGVAREERIYTIATNVVARAQSIAPSLRPSARLPRSGELAFAANLRAVVARANRLRR